MVKGKELLEKFSEKYLKYDILFYSQYTIDVFEDIEHIIMDYYDEDLEFTEMVEDLEIVSYEISKVLDIINKELHDYTYLSKLMNGLNNLTENLYK